MNQTSFTLLGFTQLQTALPIIEDQQNNAKGFTSRLLWYFPEPVFCKIRDTILNSEEAALANSFKTHLGEFIFLIPEIFQQLQSISTHF
jgi:hypothetical protein